MAVVWIQLGLTLLGLVLLDGIVILTLRTHPPIDSRAFADAYHGSTWTVEYFDELARKKTRWQPYVYWVGAKYTGKYINVDSNGFRNTTHGQGDRSDCQYPARVFTFGGSTMWGVGARDDETIASWIQKLLDLRHACVEVTNM